MKNKYHIIISILGIVICILIGLSAAILFKEKTDQSTIETSQGEMEGNEGFSEEFSKKENTEDSSSMEKEEWSADSLRKGLLTAIDYDTQYKAYISSEDEAEKAIKEYGVNQRSKYANPSVKEIELQMEQDFDILAVNLGEIDIETARDIQDAFTYMYQTYPILQGFVTNISLGNFESSDSSKIAITQTTEFIINEEFGLCPFVIKCEIILNASKFMKRDKLLETCDEMEKSGYWPKNTDITAIVVHELGHQLLDVYAKEQFGLKKGCYITKENQGAYSKYVTDMLSVNQTIPKQVLNQAYNHWGKQHAGFGYESFCESISLYAVGKQADGGISYTETFAEGITDVYLNGDNASDASKEIEKIALAFGK